MPTFSSIRLVGRFAFCTASVLCNPLAATGNDPLEPAPSRKIITFWLTLSEPAADECGEPLDNQIRKFNESVSGTLVTVLNTTNPALREELLHLSDYLQSALQVVGGQTRTFQCLKGFTNRYEEENLTIRVRIVFWPEAREMLDKSLSPVEAVAGCMPGRSCEGLGRGRYWASATAPIATTRAHTQASSRKSPR